MRAISKQRCIFTFILIVAVSFPLIVTVFVTKKAKINVKIYPLKRSQPETAETKTPSGNNASGASHQHLTNKDQVWIHNKSKNERKRYIAKQCHDYPSITKHTRVHGILSQNNTVFYCGIPKIGSTFLNSFMQEVLNCSANETCFRSINSKDSLGKYVTKQFSNQTYSFMFVREPYHRLFSAYEDKFFHPNELWTILGVRVVKAVRRSATKLSKHLGHDVTFAELVQYVVTNHEGGTHVSIDRHLKPMHTICNPCSINFNFIGNLETISDDIEFLVDDWKYKGVISKNTPPARMLETQIRYRQSFGRTSNIYERLQKHKSQVPLYKLFQRAWSSYQIRGFILKDYEMPYTDKEVRHIDEEKYILAVEKALDFSKNYKKELKSQREEAFIEAYRSVPMDLLFRLREFMKPDCLLFGYDDKPEVIFNRKNLNTSSSFTYFIGV